MDKGRKAAYDALMAVERDGGYSNLVLNRILRTQKIGDPAFVRELVYGVLSRKLLLDYMLDGLVRQGMKKTPLSARILLRMGLYQMDMMDSVPPYAAIHETVELAKSVCRGREGFINGVLRQAARQTARRMPARPEAAAGSGTAAPKSDSSRVGGLKSDETEASRPVPADQQIVGWDGPEDGDGELTAYLSVMYSASPWLCRRWLKGYGPDQAERLLAASLGRPHLCLRVNRRKGSREALIKRLTEMGIEAGAGSLSARTVVLDGKAGGLLESEAYAAGLFSVQDQAATYAADLAMPEPGQLVVDVCAAPGGKTMAMAEAMDGQGHIVAFDLYPHKLPLIVKEGRRLGIPDGMVETAVQDGTAARRDLLGRADRVLTDVPCSGLGVLRRKPELKYKEPSEEDMQELLERQARILASSAEYVKPGGLLVYSTCTVSPAENQAQIEAFLAARRDFTCLAEEQLLPAEDHDGFYVCQLKKEG